MTRDEAISTVKTGIKVVSAETARELIDLFVKLGMLKLDEPKSRLTVFFEEMNWPEGGTSYQILFRSLEKAGLKISDR